MRISNKATLQFLEHVAEFDVEALQAIIGAALARAEEAAETLGCSHYTIKAAGIVYHVENGILIAIHKPTASPVLFDD